MINETKRTVAAGAALANLSKNQDRVLDDRSDINNQVICGNYLLYMYVDLKKLHYARSWRRRDS